MQWTGGTDSIRAQAKTQTPSMLRTVIVDRPSIGQNTTMNNTPSKRRWFQFRLRTLLVMVVVVAIPLGWIGYERRRIATRREGLKEAGFAWGGQSPQPEWNQAVFGDDSPAYANSMVSGIVTDAGLVHLKNLPQLQLLALYGSHITDAGLVHLKDLPQLQTLSLDGTHITDVGLVHLQDLHQLKRLELSRTQVTDAGL